jgi:hypothetical protein
MPDTPLPVVRDFLEKWWSNPEAYPEQFKAWLTGFIASNPNLLLDKTQIPLLGASNIPLLAGSKINLNVGTTPPGSPVAGDLWIYQGSGFYWQFVYDPTETTYKWKFVGGAPLTTEVPTGQSTLSGSYVDLATVVSVTVPRSGEYVLEHGVQSINSSGSTHAASNIALKLGGAAITANEAMRSDQNASGGVDATTVSRMMKRTLSAGDVVKQQYATDGFSTYTYFQRWITAYPTKVI